MDDTNDALANSAQSKYEQNNNCQDPAERFCPKQVDPIEFIDSVDIRGHLHTIGYQPDPVEASYLIYQSAFKTLAQKHEAWKWIIDNTEDVPVPKRNWTEGWDSLHKMLQDYMAIENCIIENLKASDSNSIYQSNSELIFGERGFVRKFEDCYRDAIAQNKEYADDCDTLRKKRESGFSISKFPVSSNADDIGRIKAEFNSDGELMSVWTWDAINEALKHPRLDVSIDQDVWTLSFDGMWFDIPIPFKRGDIVQDVVCGEPFALLSTVPWVYKERGWSSDEHGDSTDMDAGGMCARCIYDMVNTAGYYCGDDCPYLRLEYYRGDFDGRNEYLQAYSAYVKGMIDINLFLTWCRTIDSKKVLEDAKGTMKWIKESAVKGQRQIGRR